MALKRRLSLFIIRKCNAVGHGWFTKFNICIILAALFDHIKLVLQIFKIIYIFSKDWVNKFIFSYIIYHITWINCDKKIPTRRLLLTNLILKIYICALKKRSENASIAWSLLDYICFQCKSKKSPYKKLDFSCNSYSIHTRLQIVQSVFSFLSMKAKNINVYQ